MPVYKLLEEMPYTELIGWGNYFKRYPNGWREDRRAYIISSSLGAKVDVATTFPTLVAIEEAQKNSKVLPGQSIKKSPWMHLLVNAEGGDKLEDMIDAQD